MKRIIGFALAVAALGAGSTLAGAQPAEQSPLDAHNRHPHHIHTGSGCRDIDEQWFEPKQPGEDRHRGLHQGAIRGQVHHGTCASGPHS